jgi:hypothetical protein
MCFIGTSTPYPLLWERLAKNLMQPILHAKYGTHGDLDCPLTLYKIESLEY